MKPELLECKVEAHLKDRGHQVIWTPPYCPELQPIELFWEAGKNHVVLKHHKDFKMKDCVKYLREGWYGNGDEYPVGHVYRKKPVDCQRLWDKCLHFSGTKYVDICDGITGGMVQLIVDPNWQDENVPVPIDTLVVNLTSEKEMEGEIYDEVDM